MAARPAALTAALPTTMAMLAGTGLRCERGGRSVLDGVSIALDPGQVVGVLGANGAGKSTLLALLAGELRPSAGNLVLDGRPLAGWRPDALARRRAVLSQSPGLSFDLDVGTVVGMGAYPFPELAPDEVQALTRRALAAADLDGLAPRRYLALSGGEQQRVQFARVLVQLLAARPAGEARALLLDEPIASLDPRHQLRLLGAVAQLAHDDGVAALVVLHDVNLAARHCDRLLLLAGGCAVADGAPAEVLTPPILERVYGLPSTVIEHPAVPGLPLVLFQP